MIHFGVIGESPYDTNPLCKVWNKEFAHKAKFDVFLPNVDGSSLDSIGKMKRLIKAESKSSKFNAFILVRDLDAFHSNDAKKEARNNWFSKLSNELKGSKCIFLLNIQELEALIFGDIETFNIYYKTKIKLGRNPELIEDPKGELIRESKKMKTNKIFQVSHNQDLIPKLDFQKVEKSCRFYAEFIQELRAYIH